MKTTIKYYEGKIFLYGILTTLYIMEYFIEVENYEECQKIIDTIRYIEKRLNTNLFTTITKDTIKEVIKSYESFGLTGDNAEENSRYYADILINEIVNY